MLNAITMSDDAVDENTPEFHFKRCQKLYMEKEFKAAIPEITEALNLLPPLSESNKEQKQKRQLYLFWRATLNVSEGEGIIDGDWSILCLDSFKYYCAALDDINSTIELTRSVDDLEGYQYKMDALLFLKAQIYNWLGNYEAVRTNIHEAITENHEKIGEYQDWLIKKFTAITDYAFFGREDFTEFNILPTVIKIGEYAFCECKNLKKITLPAGLLFMGKNAFDQCDALEEIFIPGSLKKIPYNAFANCYKLKKIIIGYGVETIGEQAFSTSNAEYVYLPDSIKEIDYAAFYLTKRISIGRDVPIRKNSFAGDFYFAYNFQNKKAGVYEYFPDGVEITVVNKTKKVRWVLQSDIDRDAILEL